MTSGPPPPPSGQNSQMVPVYLKIRPSRFGKCPKCLNTETAINIVVAPMLRHDGKLSQNQPTGSNRESGGTILSSRGP